MVFFSLQRPWQYYFTLACICCFNTLSSVLLSKRIFKGEERRGRSDSFAGLVCSVRSRKLEAPNPLWTFRCVLRSCIPLIPRSPLSPTWPFGIRECLGQIYIAAFFDPTASALVGTLGQMGRGVPGACQAGAGEEATYWRAHLSRGPFPCHNPNTHLDGNLKDCCFTPSQILASRNSQC